MTRKTDVVLVCWPSDAFSYMIKINCTIYPYSSEGTTTMSTWERMFSIRQIVQVESRLAPPWQSKQVQGQEHMRSNTQLKRAEKCSETLFHQNCPPHSFPLANYQLACSHLPKPSGQGHLGFWSKKKWPSWLLTCTHEWFNFVWMTQIHTWITLKVIFTNHPANVQM